VRACRAEYAAACKDNTERLHGKYWICRPRNTHRRRAGLLSLVFFGEQLIGRNVIRSWLGVVPLATGMFRFCPLYAVFGLNTGGWQ